MFLEKVLIDYLTLYAKPDMLDTLKNCVVYLPYSNYIELKKCINMKINTLSGQEKQQFVKDRISLIRFMNNTDTIIQNSIDNYIENIPFNRDLNCYITIVRDTNNIDNVFQNKELYLLPELVDCLSVAIFENLQIFTLNRELLRMIEFYEVSLFVINLHNVEH